MSRYIFPYEMPTHHRVRAKKEGEPAELVKGRRPSDVGLLLFCLDYCKNNKLDIGGVFDAIKQSFTKFNNTDLFDTVKAITEFRNTYIAHQEKDLTDINTVRKGLCGWITGIYKIYFAHH